MVKIKKHLRLQVSEPSPGDFVVDDPRWAGFKAEHPGAQINVDFDPSWGAPIAIATGHKEVE